MIIVYIGKVFFQFSHVNARMQDTLNVDVRFIMLFAKYIF